MGTFYRDKRDGVFLDGGVNLADIGVGALYRVTIAGKTMTLKEIDGTLLVPLKLDGQVEVVIEAVDNAK